MKELIASLQPTDPPDTAWRWPWCRCRGWRSRCRGSSRASTRSTWGCWWRPRPPDSGWRSCNRTMEGAILKGSLQFLQLPPSFAFHTTYKYCSSIQLSYCSTSLLIPLKHRHRIRTHEYEWDEADGKEELGGMQHSPFSLSSSMMRVVNPATYSESYSLII